jgi:BMFP domain-containing protein YqiC|tara:strand:- start:1058 stop:1282 length:225 start_codon:yes stop_codon:yes gene_type:complete
MDNDKFKKWSEDFSSMLPKSALEVKEDIQKNLRVLVKEAIQKMDLVEKSEVDKLKEDIEHLKSSLDEIRSTAKK